ncbi:MAG: GNAT family N-acetyltransferase [bacterium]|nr:GNAT family N-acetyltransferase [bacterium]
MQQIDFGQFRFRRFRQNQDEEDLFAALGQPEVVRHMASTGITQQDCVDIIAGAELHWQTYNIGSWAVIHQGRLAGWAGFKYWQENEFEILIVLGTEHWGLGRPIFRELVKLAKTQFHLNQIFVILPETRRSFQFIVKKAGFTALGAEEFHQQAFQKFKLTLS